MSNNAAELSKSLAAAVETVAPSIARIEGQRSGATAVVWSSAGVLLASRHFIDREDTFEASFPDGTRKPAELIGRDAGTDLAVFRADATAPVPAWSDLNDLRVGHVVLTVGRSTHSLRASFGVVRALGESFRTQAGGRVDRYVETQIAPEPGISGSVLLDTDGRALGIVTAALRRGRLMAVPRATLERVVQSFLTQGRVQRGYLGVSAYPVRLPEKQPEVGLILMAVEPGGPADRAGLLLGDVLLKLDGQPMARVNDLVTALDDRAGKSVSADVLRAGQRLDISVTLGARAVEDD